MEFVIQLSFRFVSFQAIMNYFWFKENLQTAVTMPRVHDQLYPNFVFAETKFPTEVVNGLKALGHQVGLVKD